jgi:phage shock protein PspC (stress-responsive transcriptional regulator)
MRRRAMIGVMTSQDTQRTDAPGRLLRRRTSDRVIGGVAGGIGDYFNVDPLLIRIGFVGLIIFGGAGLVLYLVAWLLMPAEGQDLSPVETVIRRMGMTPGRIITIAVVAVALLLLINSWNTGFNFSGRDGVLWAWVVIVTGFLLIRRRETPPSTAGGSVAPVAIAVGVAAVIFISSFPIGGPFDGSGYLYLGPLSVPPWALLAVAVIVVGYLLIRRRETAPATAGVAAAVAPAASAPARAPAARRPPSPLAWYVYAAVLIAVGLLALASQVGNVEVAPGQFFGAALTVIGIGLVAGAWWGRARILILLALLLVPLAVAASFITAPLEGGIGGLRFTPANAAELRDEYRIIGGTLILDLTDLSITAQPVHIAASVAVGQLVVIVPPDASVQLRARMGAGQVTVFDYYKAGAILTNVGTSLDEQYVRLHRYGPTYILDLQGGIGDLFVTNSRINW